MRRLLQLAILASSLCIVPPVSAEWFTATINRIYIHGGSNTMRVVLNGANHRCGSTTVEYYNPNDAGVRTIYAALLAWQAQKLGVQFFLEPACNDIFARFEIVESQVTY